MHGIAYWIEKRAYITPNRLALIGEQRSLTYAEMAQEMNRIAHVLSERYHLQAGERVAILSANCIDYLTLLFAVAKLGSIAVPLNIRLTQQELEFQISDSQTKLLITSQDLAGIGKQLEANTNLQGVASFSELHETLSNVQKNVSYQSLVKELQHEMGSAPFIICYTSGTTGRPKGAVLSQENMFWNGINNCLAIDITSEDKILTLLPLFHIGGIGLFAFPALLAGATVIVPNRFDPAQALQLIESQKATIVMGVPTILDALRKCERFADTDVTSVRWFYSGGAPCPNELIGFYLQKESAFGQGYGLTETSPTVFMLSKEDYRQKLGSIGKPALFCDIRIVDSNNRDVSAGEVGELLVKGPNVFQEYWNIPEQTAASFSDGWFHTGDLVRMDDDGFVYVAGRKKEMIISGGENIYPLEIEQVIGQLPAIEEAAVVGVPDEKWGEVPVAVVAVRRGHQITEQGVLAYCLSMLAKYKCPKRIFFVPALPKNATGKIDKALLKKQYNKTA